MEWTGEAWGRRLAVVLLCCAAGYRPSLSAQAPPDAGRIQEQLRPPEPPRKPAVPQIRIAPPPGEAKADTPPFFVASFRVTGATVFREERLQSLLGAPRRAMTLAEVQALAERLTNLYKEHGYIVARALIPAQDVREGVVEVRVVEGRYERIDINNASDISEARIRGLLGGVREDAIVHGPTLERAVLLISDLAGIQPKATLEPGAQAGFTNLVLEIVPGRALDYDLVLDNAGARATGRYRLSAGATLNSPLKIGDRLAARVITTGEKLLSARLAYDAPLGSSGARGNAYLSETTYKLGEPFEALEARGAARSIGAGVSYPLVRSAERTLRLSLGGEARELVDRIGSLDIVNEKSLRLLQWGGGGDVRDDFLGGAITAFQALVTHGGLVLHTPALVAADAATARTQGNFYKLSLTANRLQGLTESLRLLLSYTGQFAADNLDSSEKFSVGGMTGVRAYPPGEAAGDDTQLFQVELRYNAGALLGGQLTPSLFVDHARSRLNHEPWEGFTSRNDRRLSGFGAGAEWSMPGFSFVRGWYARRLRTEPATADEDRAGRLWLQAGMLF